jgi:hypothetical protein
MNMQLIGTFLVFMTLLGSVSVPTATAYRSDHESRQYHEDRGSRHEREYRNRRSRESMPDRFVIDKPGKCEIRCERRWTGEYRCKEYRC